MKFRSMRVDTPRDMPTHLLSDPQRSDSAKNRRLPAKDEP